MAALRHGGHRGRQRPVLLAARAALAAGQAHPGRLRRRRLRVVHRHRRATRPPPGTSPPSRARWPCCSPGSCAPTPSTSRPGGTWPTRWPARPPSWRWPRPSRSISPSASTWWPGWPSGCGDWWPCGSRCPATRGVPWLTLGAAGAGGGWWWPSLLVAVLPAPQVSTVAHLPVLVGRLLAGRQRQQPHRRLGIAARPRGQPLRPDRRRAASSGFAKSLDTGGPGLPRATRW